MREIIPGIFRTTAVRQPIGARVSSYYVQPAGLVIDPKVPKDGLAGLPGRPQQVPDRVKRGLKPAFHGLLTRELDHLLFAHGDPLVGGGRTALREFVTSPVGHEDFGQAR